MTREKALDAVEKAIDRAFDKGKELAIPNVSQQRELFVAMFNKMNDDDIQECTNGFAERVFERISNQ